MQPKDQPEFFYREVLNSWLTDYKFKINQFKINQFLNYNLMFRKHFFIFQDKFLQVITILKSQLLGNSICHFSWYIWNLHYTLLMNNAVPPLWSGFLYFGPDPDFFGQSGPDFAEKSKFFMKLWKKTTKLPHFSACWLEILYGFGLVFLEFWSWFSLDFTLFGLEMKVGALVMPYSLNLCSTASSLLSCSLPTPCTQTSSLICNFHSKPSSILLSLAWHSAEAACAPMTSLSNRNSP